MNIFKKIRRAIVTNIPGSQAQADANFAKEKRQLEHQLRADGWSRAAAVAEVARRLNHG